MEPKLTANQLLANLPYLFGNEPEYFTELGKSLPDHASILCLGSGPGEMSLFLLESRPTLRILAVDYNVSVVNTYRAHLNSAGFSSTVYVGKTTDLYNFDEIYPEYCPIQLLIVDADHSEQAVIDDINTFWNFTAVGSIIFFHDFVDIENNDTNGVASALEYLCTKGCLKDSVELIAEPGVSRVYRRIK